MILDFAFKTTLMRNDKPNLIVDKTIDFSLALISYCEKLEGIKKYVIARQLLKSATSIGATYLKRKMPKAKLISSIK